MIVTGAAGGIGSETLRALAARGARVLAVDLDRRAAERAAEDAGRFGGEVEACPVDISDEEAVRALVEHVQARWGRLDGIFNNAAVVGLIAPIGEYAVDEFDRLFRTNVRGVWLGMKHALPALRESGGGSILNTASTAGLMGWPQLSAYVGSKHAVIGLTRAVAVECAAEGIRVNAICPGPTDTPMLSSIGESVAPNDRTRAQRLQEANVPAGRIGRPEEVASLATWLLLDAPLYLTGAVLTVDGAQTAGFGVQATS